MKKAMGAGFVFVCEGDILFIRRNMHTKHNAGKWCTPGGRSDKGEVPIKTAKRETFEEIGKLPKYKVFKVIKIKRPKAVYYAFVSTVNKQFKPKLSHEHIAYKWMTAEKALKKGVSAWFKKPLKKLAEGLIEN